MPTLRLLSYNVHSLRDDAAAVARVIRAAEPDVVCIQEAPRFLRWRSKCAALARASGLVIVSGGRPTGANLLLSTLALDVIDTWDVQFSKDPGLHQRGTALAVLELRGSRFAVAGTHLDLAEEPRLRHVGELHAAIDDLAGGVPSVVAGDVNDLPDSTVWRALAERRRDAWDSGGGGDGYTYASFQPMRRIDGVFVDSRLGVRSAVAVDSVDVPVASDHRPVLVELDLP